MAGPLRRLSMRIGCLWASMACPISPPSASTSRTICPLATPPIAGLQLICPTVSQLVVSSAGGVRRARGSRGGLSSGMAGADHDHIELVLRLRHGLHDRWQSGSGEAGHRSIELHEPGWQTARMQLCQSVPAEAYEPLRAFSITAPSCLNPWRRSWRIGLVSVAVAIIAFLRPRADGNGPFQRWRLSSRCQPSCPRQSVEPPAVQLLRWRRLPEALVAKIAATPSFCDTC